MPKVSIRFDYFSVAMANKTEQYVDLTELLEAIKCTSSKDKIMEYIQGNTVRILEMVFYSRYTYQYTGGDKVETVQYPFWYIVFTRSRPDLPEVLKRDALELEPLDLDDDEYLSENTVMLYDSIKGIAIVQRNLAGVPIKFIQNMMNQHIKDDNKLIEFQPIVDKNALTRVKNQGYHRSINFRLSHLGSINKDLDDDSTLDDIMESTMNFSTVDNTPLQLEVNIKIPGNTRKFSLKNSMVDKLIRRLMKIHSEQENVVDKLTIKGATDEEAQIEEIDLLGPVVRDKVIIDTDESRFIASDKLMERMLRKYSQIRNRF